jgi:tripartite-type tricarboxylate transporter receptor subunit TctC
MAPGHAAGLRSILIVLAVSAAVTANAQDADSTIKVPAQITILVGTPPGGAYDTYSRLVARHMGRSLPGNPNLVVQYMPGASGTRALNHLHAQAPRDGSLIATFNSAAAFYQRIGQPGIRYDAGELSWIGSLNRAVDTLAVWHTAGIKTLDDAKTKEVIVGASGAGGVMAAYPRLMNNVLGTKFKIVTGYEGGNSVLIAMERGEIDGPGNRPWSAWKAVRSDWIKDHKIIPLVQLSLQKDPELQDVPLLLDLARNDEERQMFRFLSGHTPMEQPFAGPPKLPAPVLALYRRAFTAMYESGPFKDDVTKSGFDLDPRPGNAVEGFVKATLATPQSIVDRVVAAIGGVEGGN